MSELARCRARDGLWLFTFLAGFGDGDLEAETDRFRLEWEDSPLSIGFFPTLPWLFFRRDRRDRERDELEELDLERPRCFFFLPLARASSSRFFVTVAVPLALLLRLFFFLPPAAAPSSLRPDLLLRLRLRL